MPLYKFLHNLLNVLIQIANKTGLEQIILIFNNGPQFLEMLYIYIYIHTHTHTHTHTHPYIHIYTRTRVLCVCVF
jgi:hypothetical protein